MGKFLALLILSAGSAWAQPSSAEFPIPRLKGLFFYQEHFEVSNIRRAETVPSETPEGQERIKELRADGYSCIRKNTVTRLCSKNWKPEENPPGVENSVRNFMKGIQVQFEGSTSKPVLSHDGSTTQEWDVYEKVQIVQTQVSLYRVVRNSKGQIYVAFPVNATQPMSPLKFHSESKLGMTAIGNIKDTPTSTVAYTIEAYLEKELKPPSSAFSPSEL